MVPKMTKTTKVTQSKYLGPFPDNKGQKRRYQNNMVPIMTKRTKVTKYRSRFPKLTKMAKETLPKHGSKNDKNDKSDAT